MQDLVEQTIPMVEYTGSACKRCSKENIELSSYYFLSLSSKAISKPQTTICFIDRKREEQTSETY